MFKNSQNLFYVMLVCFLILGLTTPAAAQPTAPDSVVAFPSYGAANEIVVRFQDTAGDETGFEVRRKSGTGGWTLVASLPDNPGTGQVEWRDNTIILDTLYTYRVRSVNADGNSAWAGPTEETQLPTNNFWPREDGVRDIMIIWSGSASGNWQKFHEGVDFHAIEPVADPPPIVRAIRGGVLATVAFSGPGLTVAVEVSTGPGTTEYDYYLHLQDITTKSTGDQIAPGEYLGRISFVYSSGIRHTHIMRMAANSLLGSNCRSPWLNFSLAADLDPFGNDPHLLDQSGSSIDYGPDGRVVFAVDATTPATVRDPVRGDVDLLVEAYDNMNTSLAYENNVSAVGYWVESHAPGGTDIGSSVSPLRLCDFDDTWFSDYTPIVDKFNAVYDDTRPHVGLSIKRSHYIITSATTSSGDPGDVDGSKFWRTKARTGSGSAPYFESALTARHNSEARFPDGNYTVHVLISDQVHTDVQETRDIILDNWLPLVTVVQVQSTDILSSASWVFNDFTDMMDIDFPLGTSDIVEAGDSENDITFTITFSEPMASVSLSIPGVTWNSPVVTLTANTDATIWIGVLTGGYASTDPSGIYYLHIDGTDLAGNPLAGRTNFTSFDPLVDLDPNSGTTGTDNVHRFAIATKRDIVLLLDRSGSMWNPALGFSSKMEALKDAGNIFLDILDPSAHTNIAGVKYDNIVEVLCPGCAMAPAVSGHIDDIRAGINGLTPRNSTSIGGGLVESANQLSLVGDEKNLVLLFTDGKHNYPPSVANGLAAIHALVPDNTTISAIGLGEGIHINIPQLQNIVSSTNGELWTTASALELHKFFIEALMNAGGTPYSIFIADPTTTINKGDVKQHNLTISTSDRQIGVVVEWGNVSGPLKVHLLSPNNKLIDAAVAAGNPSITFSGGTRYALYQLHFPLGNSRKDSLSREWEGTWRIVIDAAEASSSSIEYAYSVISSSDLSVDTRIVGGNVPGEKMYVLAKLLYKGKPIEGRLSAVIDYPLVSTPNVIGSFDISDDTLDYFKDLLKKEEVPDIQLSPTEIYTYALTQKFGKQLRFPRVQVKKKFTLASVAQIKQLKNVKVNPGEFVVELPETKAAGDYRITVQVNSVGREKHSSRWVFLTKALKPQIDPMATRIEVYSERDLHFIDKTKAYPLYIEVTPQDRLGNLLGGGLLDTKDFSIKAKGARVLSIKDRGNGTYIVTLMPRKKRCRIPVKLKIREKLLKLTVTVKGKIIKCKIKGN